MKTLQFAALLFVVASCSGIPRREPAESSSYECAQVFSDTFESSDQSARSKQQISDNHHKISEELVTRFVASRGKNFEYDTQVMRVWENLKIKHWRLFDAIGKEDSSVDIIFFLNMNELKAIARNQRVSELIAEKLSGTTHQLTASTLHRNARIMLVAEFIDSLASTKKHYSEEDFLFLADLEDQKSQVFKSSYRFDSRGPEEIRSSFGFYPNPAKALGSFLEHSAPSSQGSGFVSLSAKQGNEFNLLIGPVLKSSHSIEENQLDRHTLTQARARSYVGKMQILETYEYSIENQLGVRSMVDPPVKEEAEIVAPYVAFRKIVAFRKVVYVIDRVQTLTGITTKLDLALIRYGPWSPM